ncbi:universal stress protein [Deinococcus sp.]|uniref:universal stress protein n=1 Tax=Deinococcus sp. TaxID=47478 RepID=UPI0025FEA34A|nr:universal stress protein [Deinococcus sp.]
MFDHILVTTDGSALSTLALPVAADLARTYDSRLTLLYIVPRFLLPTDGVAYTYNSPAEHAQLIAEGQRILVDAQQILDYPRAEVSRVQCGDLKTEQVIAREVQRSGAKLVVMSTHGRSGLAHLFLGSVAEAVLRLVHVPVLLVQQPSVAADAAQTP